MKEETNWWLVWSSIVAMAIFCAVVAFGVIQSPKQDITVSIRGNSFGDWASLYPEAFPNNCIMGGELSK